MNASASHVRRLVASVKPQRSLAWVASIQGGCVPERSTVIEDCHAALDRIEAERARDHHDRRDEAAAVEKAGTTDARVAV